MWKTHAESKVEALAVFWFLIIPFTLAGCLYSWKRSSFQGKGQRIVSLLGWKNKTVFYRSDLVFWVTQLVIHGVWFALRLHHFERSGKLKKSGILKCTAKALGINSLLALVS